MIYKTKKISFSILVFLSFLLCEDKSINIHVMEFDNLDKNLRYNNLTRDLPNFIINEYSNFDNISIQYAGNIKPYLNKNKNSNITISDHFIILGSFAVDDEKIMIFYELIDYENWMNIASDQLEIPFKDLGYIEKAFVDRVHDLLRPFVSIPVSSYDYVYDIDSSINGQSKDLNNIKDQNSLHVIEKNIVTALDELEFYYDTYNKLKKIDLDRGQFGNRYYREFDLREINKQALGYEKNTEILLKAFDDILGNPYDIFIGEMDLNVTGSKDGKIQVEVPVQYSVKMNLIDEMLNHLPHYRDVKDDGMVFYEFSADHYMFSNDLLNYLSKIQYQVTPLIFFNDRDGKVKLIIIDSWKDKYDQFEIEGIEIVRNREFSPLLSITPGVNNIQLHIEPTTSDANYVFLIKGSDLGFYSKMTVKFIHENKLDEYLNDISKGIN